jgi:hypothetical protein
MSSEHSEIRLILHVDLYADPITGSLTRADGGRRPFSGWISLVAALNAIRDDLEQAPTGSA